MKHVIEVFDRDTEELIFSVVLPEHRKEDLKLLMNWQKPGDDFDGYDLSDEQIKILGEWTGEKLFDKQHIVQLVCIE